MGFFDFIRKGTGKKTRAEASQKAKPIKLKLNDVPSWLDGEFSGRIAEIDARAKGMCLGIIKSFSIRYHLHIRLK